MQDCGLYVVTPVSTGGGGGSSALPSSTNSIWNLTSTANTFSGNGGGLTNLNLSGNSYSNVTFISPVFSNSYGIGAEMVFYVQTVFHDGSTLTNIQFQSVISDSGGMCDTTNSQFYIRSAGYYTFSATFSYQQAVQPDTVCFTKNGVPIDNNFYLAYTLQPDQPLSTMNSVAYFNVGDVIKLAVAPLYSGTVQTYQGEASIRKCGP
jgi:hypothetical protein